MLGHCGAIAFRSTCNGGLGAADDVGISGGHCVPQEGTCHGGVVQMFGDVEVPHRCPMRIISVHAASMANRHTVAIGVSSYMRSQTRFRALCERFVAFAD